MSQKFDGTVEHSIKQDINHIDVNFLKDVNEDLSFLEEYLTPSIEDKLLKRTAVTLRKLLIYGTLHKVSNYFGIKIKIPMPAKEDAFF